MTDLRTAAQQALEAMLNFPDDISDEMFESITALKAALAEPVQEPVWVCPDSAEHRYQKPGHCEDCGKTLVQVAEPVQQGCDHCNHPLYAAVKCRVCGRVTQAEPVQEPVAWIYIDPDKPSVKFLEWRENEPGYRGRWVKTPLYAAPNGITK